MNESFGLSSHFSHLAGDMTHQTCKALSICAIPEYLLNLGPYYSVMKMIPLFCTNRANQGILGC